MPKAVQHEPHNRLRLEIDGQWDASDFGRLFSFCDDFYNLHVFADVAKNDPWFFEEAWRFWELPLRYRTRHPASLLRLSVAEEPLKQISSVINDIRDVKQIHIRVAPPIVVAKIQFGSPGFTDLAGLGTIVGHLKDFFLAIVEHFAGRKKRLAEAVKAELENDLLRLQVAHKAVEVLKDAGFTKRDIKTAVQALDGPTDDICKLVISGKLVGVKLIDQSSGPHVDDPTIKRPRRAIQLEDDDDDDDETKGEDSK